MTLSSVTSLFAALHSLPRAVDSLMPKEYGPSPGSSAASDARIGGEAGKMILTQVEVLLIVTIAVGRHPMFLLAVVIWLLSLSMTRVDCPSTRCVLMRSII